jgi:hypothetical protein
VSENDDELLVPSKIVLRNRRGEVVETVGDPAAISRGTLRKYLPRGGVADVHVEGQPLPVRVTRRTLWEEFEHRAPVWVAVLGVAFLWFVQPGYEGIVDYIGPDESSATGSFLLAAVGIAFVVLIIVVVTHLRAERPRQAWLWPLLGGAAALLVLTAFRSVGDAYILRNNNCWVVETLEQSRGDSTWSVWACAPGDHRPHEYEDLETEFDGRLTEVVGGSSRTCEFYDRTLIESGDAPFELSDADIDRLQGLPRDDYWLCEEAEF